jgi:SAM-dependent methyltransferase
MVRKITAYLKYFFYLGWNWNFRLATTILWYEIKGEKKYGVDTIGINDLVDSVTEKDREGASIYQPVNYYIGEWLFSCLTENEKAGKSFMDAGCGRGRVMAMAAYHGFKKIFGFDISPRLCYEAIPNIETIKARFPSAEISLECIDAKQVEIPDDCSVIFLFNPFDKTVMEPFVRKVTESLIKFPRNMKVLYANPECRQLWLSAGFVETASVKKLKWLQGLVLEYKPS